MQTTPESQDTDNTTPSRTQDRERLLELELEKAICESLGLMELMQFYICEQGNQVTGMDRKLPALTKMGVFHLTCAVQERLTKLSIELGELRGAQ